MRDHGGNIDAAKALYGGDDWIDLSTGINRVPYPLPNLPAHVWTMLPTEATKEALMQVARAAFGTTAHGIATAGAQAAIQMVPRLRAPGHAKVLAPTYNEHGAALLQAGWQVDEVPSLTALAGADLAVVVNPNNPTGQFYTQAELTQIRAQVGLLIVDESFADPDPAQTMIGQLQGGAGGLIVLRSFGKFWGLAGARLGFAFGDQDMVARLRDMAGPWPVSGAAIEIGKIALQDRAWRDHSVMRLSQESAAMDRMAQAAGWQLVGGTALFRTYDTGAAQASQEHLARAQIWSRIFPYSSRWLRLGLPGTQAEWKRLSHALDTI
ncbi:threonine-phosphate decarboxylase [Thioclava sp. SK-1]|uniref:threonine-phosphate decarboxylase CobD n=1 Tax=Thioclava sp. SK-1 TaxID=1889770 RepID=UPI0008257541|nr:threonine-phosphate decarboxylase CobD [Thioclava sp. SK-1]OCX65980.1 threonine-phosphate decarboxylase [Thioclava sp. SK-1]